MENAVTQAVRGCDNLTHQAPPADFLGALTEVERKHAPPIIYFAGDAELLRMGPKVSIVGSRAASEVGLRRARALATELVKHGAIVVSGLAAGIDTAAHEAALKSNGRTIAVIGTPLDQSYPKANAHLQALLMREHLVVTQLAPGTQVRPYHFPIRNRLMALLTDATVIVEAGDSSGTLHQGWEAIRLGRPLFLLESVIADSKLEWPRKMMDYGAQVLSRDNLAMVIEDLPSFAHANVTAFAN
jgi:DNA processing protein